MVTRCLMDNNQNKTKPLILLKKECEDNLVQVVNSSGLPAFILEPILMNLLQNIQRLSRIEYEESLKNYNNTSGGDDI